MKKIILLFIVGILLFRYLSAKPQPKLTNTQAGLISVSPTIESDSTQSVDSPDGSGTLILKSQKNPSTNKYSFYSRDNSSDEENLLKTVSVASAHSFLLPENSWSPDNKYVFIVENKQTRKAYYVLSATESASEDQLTDVHELFAQNYPVYSLAEITGWAAPNLLILNTTMSDGKRGPSFWYDVSYKKFIQLGTQF